jgi:hypothetical protein
VKNIRAIEKSNANFYLRRRWAGQNLSHDATKQAGVLAAMKVVGRYL